MLNLRQVQVADNSVRGIGVTKKLEMFALILHIFELSRGISHIFLVEFYKLYVHLVSITLKCITCLFFK